MSDFGSLLNAGIEIGSPGGLVGFRNPVRMYQGFINNIGRGDVYFVDSNNGSQYNTGRTPKEALDKLDNAVNKCTANQGDKIYLLPGHSESVSSAGGIALDTAGISVIGLGVGADRPTITFDTDVGADMDISAASVYLQNILFVNGINNLTAPIHITAADVILAGIETRDNDSNYYCNDFIKATADADRLQVVDWVHNAYGGKTGASSALTVAGADDVVIIPSHVVGDFSTACIENSAAGTNLQILGRATFPAYLRTQNSADVIVTCDSSTTGRVGPFLNARLEDDASNITGAFVGSAMEFFQPINIVNADGESSMETNISASTD